MTDDFKFQLVGTERVPFAGYVSQEDPTRLSPQVMVRGSQNTILYNNGNIGPRPGKKRYDPVDNTQDPVVSSFDWNDTDGNTLLVRVLASGKLQFYRTSNETWYTIEDGFTNTDFSFAKWWSLANSKELLVMANGANSLYAWSGGFADDVGAVNNENAILISGGPFIDTFAFTSSVDGVLTYMPDPPTSATGYILLEDNPAPGFLQATLDGALVPATGIFIEFVNALTPPAVPEAAQVLIGATKEDTATNLLGLLQNPAANTATQNGFTSGDVQSLIGYSTYAFTPALESGNAETWTEQGFIDGGNLVIGTDVYSYRFVAGRYLVDIDTSAGDPPTGQFTYSGLVTTDMSSQTGTYEINFLLCLRNQIVGCSYTNRVVYISSNQDTTNSTGYNDWVQVGDVILGDPDFAVLDDFPKGGITRGESAYIGAGVSSWYELTPNTTSPELSGAVYTKVTKFSGAGLTAPLGFNFVTTLGEDIIFIDQKNQLRTLGFYRNIDTQKSPSLSLAVRQELEQEDFTGGTLEAIDEFVYIVAPISGKTYIYEIRDDVDEVGNITSKRHWQPFQTWSIVRLSIVNGVVHGYSAETPQLYQLWDTELWVDETSVAAVYASYVSRARLAYQQIGERDNLGSFDKVFYEGYILPGSDLTANTYYDYQGSTKITQADLGSILLTPVLFGRDNVNLIGDSIIGAELIGGGLTDENYPNPMPKFRAIVDTRVDACFEFSLELVSENAGSRWEILALGANPTKSPQSPTILKVGSTVISN